MPYHAHAFVDGGYLRETAKKFEEMSYPKGEGLKVGSDGSLRLEFPGGQRN